MEEYMLERSMKNNFDHIAPEQLNAEGWHANNSLLR
jgi:hypothetical protein